jgi:UDP-N-acetylmuramate dehydrogenase
MKQWLQHLPQVRGRYAPHGDLKKMVWFQVGGPAEVVFKPADAEDLSAFLRQLPQEVPVTVLGVGSNVLIRDQGVDGAVVKLTREFTKIKIDGDMVTAGAGALAKTVALEAASHGIEGLEFLSGIPGSMGGVVKMNAGAYGSELKDVIISCSVVDRKGQQKTLESEDITFTYRHSSLPDDWIVVETTLQGQLGDKKKIQERLDFIMQERERSQPIRAKTGGSTFKNPPGHSAWKLIDEAGCRGLKKGDAQVSEKHCNFLINTGHATAADLEALGEEVRKKVKATSGVELEWEVIRLGKGN